MPPYVDPIWYRKQRNLAKATRKPVSGGNRNFGAIAVYRRTFPFCPQLKREYCAALRSQAISISYEAVDPKSADVRQKRKKLAGRFLPTIKLFLGPSNILPVLH